jgi:alkanesulfonate monooxygenase SsuD/methylene tetrahydromethanopterin reductase-like flavin-dependent oxidoreductase (luciferase family)
MLLLPRHRPVRVAEDVAVLDNIANGRFILGVAAGYHPIEFEGLGEGRKGREARMEEQLEILIKSWTMDSFAHSGKHYQFPEISVMPKPAQKPHPPIWIGASTEGGFRRAAKWADALCSSPRHHLSDLKNHYASYRRYLKEYGRKEVCTPVIREVYCAEAMKQAEEEGGPGMGSISRPEPCADPNEAAKSKEGRALEDRSALVSEAEAARFKERNAITGHRFAVTHWRMTQSAANCSPSTRQPVDTHAAVDNPVVDGAELARGTSQNNVLAQSSEAWRAT